MRSLVRPPRVPFFSLAILACAFAATSLSPARAQPAAKAADDGKTFTLVRIDVTRKYQFTPPDKTAKLLKPGLEWVKETPSESASSTGFQMGAARAAYVSAGTLKVEAPPVVVDGQAVTIKATGHSTWEFKSDRGAELTQTLRVAMRDQEKQVDATLARDLKDSIHEVEGEQSVTLTMGEDQHIRKWEKDGLRYRSFTANLSNRHGKTDTETVEAVFIYLQGAMTAATSTPAAAVEPPPVAPVQAAAAETKPVEKPVEPGFGWWWLLLLLLIPLAWFIWKMAAKMGRLEGPDRPGD